jgi:hypothetical protein
MKRMYFLLGAVLIGTQLLAQTSNSTLTIQLKGDQNRSITIDNRDYTPSGYNAMNNATITVNDLSVGQHLLEVNRARSRNYRNADVNTTFTIRNNYDKTIIVEEDGSLHQTETPKTGSGYYGGNYNSYDRNSGYSAYPMNDAMFTNLYNSVRIRFGNRARANQLSMIFNNESYLFTTAQAEQLIRLVSNENNRLQLAKAAYPHITDPENFGQINDMLGRRSSINQLDLYVRTYSGTHYGNTYGYQNNGSTYGYQNNSGFPAQSAMSDYEFERQYRNISNTFGIGAKMSELTRLFERQDLYYTVDQAERLIRLVSDQDNRLQLAKQVYSHIVDPQNIANLYDIFDRQSTINEFRNSVGIRQ